MVTVVDSIPVANSKHAGYYNYPAKQPQGMPINHQSVGLIFEEYFMAS